MANGSNNRGRVVIPTETDVVAWEGSAVRVLPSLGAVGGKAAAINGWGEIPGDGTMLTEAKRAALWR